MWPSKSENSENSGFIYIWKSVHVVFILVGSSLLAVIHNNKLAFVNALMFQLSDNCCPQNERIKT